MKFLPLCRLLFLGCGVFLVSCTSVSPQIERVRSLKGVQHFFVVTNLNDNHAIDRHIAAVLQSRGLDASNGPLTMMPDDAQAVVTYQDRWSWDFGDHLVFLSINVHQANSERQFASAVFQVRVPLRKSP